MSSSVLPENMLPQITSILPWRCFSPSKFSIIRCKVSANRAKNKISSLIFSSEMQPNLSKVSANRAKNKISSLIFSSEMQPNLSKVSANRAKNKISCLFFRGISVKDPPPPPPYEGRGDPIAQRHASYVVHPKTRIQLQEPCLMPALKKCSTDY